MAKVAAHYETTGRVQVYEKAIIDYLKKEKVASAEMIEDFVQKTFGAQFDKADLSMVVRETIKGKIVKWRNDVHWARVLLTRADLTLTVGDWVAWLPCVGRVHGTSLVDYHEASDVVRHLLWLLTDKKANE